MIAYRLSTFVFFSSYHFIGSKVNYCLIVKLQSDPFNRSHLTADMLIPDVELKAKIEEFVNSQELKKQNLKSSLQSAKDLIQTTDTTTLIE